MAVISKPLIIGFVDKREVFARGLWKTLCKLKGWALTHDKSGFPMSIPINEEEALELGRTSLQRGNKKFYQNHKKYQETDYGSSNNNTTEATEQTTQTKDPKA